MEYRWSFRKEADEENIHKLTKELKIPKSLARVLCVRGIDTVEKAGKFFEPSLKDLYDPYLMRDMEKAVERILGAIKRGGIIWLHGDYDVDGTASTSLMMQYLRNIGGKVDFYIPDRFEEGYGLSVKSVQSALDKKADLILTVDVGITSYEALEYAKKKGIDCILCDHHEPGDEIPEVYAIIDPLLPGCKYPFKQLSACGVAFKIIQAISQKIESDEDIYSYLDLVAIASAADMVPLVDENRILVYYGINQLNTNPRPGIKGLIDCTNLRIGQIATSNIVYGLAPLINAAGRMGDAVRSVKMMTEKSVISAFQIAQKLEQENRRRRVFDDITFQEAIPMADELMKSDTRSLVLFKQDWHAGVIGIVASRLVDRYNLPTVLLTNFEGLAKGSARSITGFDIHAALKKCSRFLIEFGGHKHAAGLSLKKEDVEEFRVEFDKLARERISRDMLVPEIILDAELKFNELSPNFLNALNTFAPYGYDNFKPVFYTKGVKSVNGVKMFGANNLKFRAIQSNFSIDAVGYGLGDKLKYCNSGNSFSIVYNLEMNYSNGSNAPILLLKDIRPDES